MLKTNSKKAKEHIKAYIINNFDCSNYDLQTEPQTFAEIADFIYKCFIKEKYNNTNAYCHNNNNEDTAFYDWCAGLPSVLDTCYFYNRSAVDDLGIILEETETEKQRYTATQAEKLLTQLIFRTIKQEVQIQ